MNQELTVVVAALAKRGKHRGFLTMAEVQQELEDAEASGEAFEEVADALRAKGIKLTEEGPGATEEFIEVGATSVSDLTALRPVSACSRCHEIASPSRSGSVARMSLLSSFKASAMARTCFWLSGATSHFMAKSCSGSTEPSLAGRSRTCP